MYRFDKINENYFDQLVQWKYDNEFSCYDIEDRFTNIDNLFDKDGYDFFIGLNDDEEIVGYMECFFKDGLLEVGHGLNPVFIGKGMSYDFISSSIQFAVEYYDYIGEIIRILIEPFNEIAIKVYSRIGFTIANKTNEYVMMELNM